MHTYIYIYILYNKAPFTCKELIFMIHFMIHGGCDRRGTCEPVSFWIESKITWGKTPTLLGYMFSAYWLATHFRGNRLDCRLPEYILDILNLDLAALARMSRFQLGCSLRGVKEEGVYYKFIISINCYRKMLFAHPFTLPSTSKVLGHQQVFSRLCAALEASPIVCWMKLHVWGALAMERADEK